MYFVHPSTDILVDIYRSTLGQYVDRDMSVDLSTDVYRPSDGQHIDQLSADISVDVSADNWPIC